MYGLYVCEWESAACVNVTAPPAGQNKTNGTEIKSFWKLGLEIREALCNVIT